MLATEQDEPTNVVTFPRGPWTYRRVEFLLKWYVEIVWTYRLPQIVEEDAGHVLGNVHLWATQEEWQFTLCQFDLAWEHLDTVDADAAIWLWEYYVLNAVGKGLTIDQLARRERCRFSRVQQRMHDGIRTMVNFLNGEM